MKVGGRRADIRGGASGIGMAIAGASLRRPVLSTGKLSRMRGGMPATRDRCWAGFLTKLSLR